MRIKTDLFSRRMMRLLFVGCGLLLLAAVLPAQEKTLTIDLGGGVKMEFVLIPAGSFMMGSNTGDADERPVHRVTITRLFYIGKYEVTQEQWRALVGNNPSYFKGPKNPVEQVSWVDCQDYFIARLEPKVKVSGLKPRLPTEAEWEYACRAGSTANYCYGDREADLRQYAWYGDCGGNTHPVGEKEPNDWGLYDMYGNVWEWCTDVYEEYYYGASPENDPQGPDNGECRVIRGGSWCSGADGCRSAGRDRIIPAVRSFSSGFRVVLEIK